MATYVNDLRLKEIATGDEAGTWGTSTNTNLQLIGEALGYGTQDCFASDADATTTVADGATDPARAMYFKVTSSATLTATRTLTIAPNTVSRVMLIENATTGSQSIAISQGSGGNVTIASGQTKMVYLDGAGATGAVVDALADLELGTITVANLTATTADINGGTIDGVTIGGASAGAGTFTTLNATGGGALTGTWTDLGSVTTVDINGGTIDGVTIGGSSAGAGSFTTLNTSGNVGIGATPTGFGRLDVSLATNKRIITSTSAAYGGQAIVGINDSGSEVSLGIAGASLGFYTNATDRVLIANNGDISFYEDTGTTPKFFWDASAEALSVGTTDVFGKISVVAAADANNDVWIRNTNSGSSAACGVVLNAFGNSWRMGMGSSANNSNALTWAVDVSGANSEKMRLDTSGNLGLGVVPSAWNSGYKAFQWGTVSNLQQGASSDTSIANNYYVNSAGNALYITSNYASVYRQASGAHEWYTAASGTAGNAISFTQAMTLNASGNLLVGGTTLGAAGSIALESDGDIRSVLASGAGGDTIISAIFGVSNGYQISVDASNNQTYKWHNGGTQSMTLDSSGNLLVGTTSAPSGSVAGAALMANNQIIASRGSAAALALYRPDNNGDVALFHKGTTQVGSISVTGAATAYNTSSDARLKENIADAEDAGAKVDAIKVRQFDWKADGSHQDYGMIAQELLTVAPEAVSGDPESDDMMGVDYSKLVPMLVKEIQSLRARVAQLEGV